MIKQPYYMLEFTAKSCMFEIRINDVPVLTINLSGQASSRIPINHAISESGKQEVGIKILPLLDEASLHPDASLSYVLHQYEVIRGFDLKNTFSEYKSPEVGLNKTLPIIVNNSIFDATIPYQLKDDWKQGEDLEDIEDLHEKLRIEYLSIAQLIQEKRYELYKEKIAIREQNIASSMYLNKQESEGRFKRLVKDFENGYDHVEFPEDTLLIYSAYGKKASLRRRDGDPALSFVNKEEMEQQMLDIEFYYNIQKRTLEII